MIINNISEKSELNVIILIFSKTLLNFCSSKFLQHFFSATLLFHDFESQLKCRKNFM